MILKYRYFPYSPCAGGWMFENVKHMSPADLFEEIDARRSTGVTDFLDGMRIQALENELDRRGMLPRPNKLRPVKVTQKFLVTQTIHIHATV